MRQRGGWVLLVFLCSTFVLNGCTALVGSQVEPSPLVEDRIKAALIESLGAAAAAIDAEQEDSRIRLRGFVETEQQRRRAQEIAQGVPGVPAVVNEIEVK